MRILNGALAMCAMMLCVTLAMTVGASAAMNQPPEEQGAPGYSGGPGAASPQTIDDATLKHAAAAYVKVRDITLKTRQVLNKTNDEAKKHQIMEQAESEKVAAVKTEGMQPQQYNQVIMLVQADNQLQQKFLSYVRKAKGAPSGTM
jgi:hypothetical protein